MVAKPKPSGGDVELIVVKVFRADALVVTARKECTEKVVIDQARVDQAREGSHAVSGIHSF